jgi:hypothetical protein
MDTTRITKTNKEEKLEAIVNYKKFFNLNVEVKINQSISFLKTMNENFNTSEKPNLRSKGSKMGVKSGNTIKFDHRSQDQINKTSTFCVQKIDAALTHSKHAQQYNFFGQINHNNPTVSLSLNKNKAWEKIEDTKNDPNYIVTEQLGMHRENMEIKDKYTNFKPEEKEEEGEWEVVKGRKGKTIKPKKVTGKVKKEQEKIQTEAKFVVYVEKKNPKGSGPVFQQMVKKTHDDYWNGTKNYESKKRRQLKSESVL